MIKLETLMSYSVENFLNNVEIEKIISIVESIKKENPNTYNAGYMGKTVHSIKDLDSEQVVKVFEPEGRIEITDLPNELINILNNAFYRNVLNVNRAYPSAKKPDCWMYLEYKPTQFITPHADLFINESRPENPKITGINILLNDEAQGGEFFIETCGSEDIWDSSKELVLKEGINYSSDWFRKLPRTRWISKQNKGTALFYGTQLIHGTEIVESGITKKIVGFITGE